MIMGCMRYALIMTYTFDIYEEMLFDVCRSCTVVTAAVTSAVLGGVMVGTAGSEVKVYLTVTSLYRCIKM